MLFKRNTYNLAHNILETKSPNMRFLITQKQFINIKDLEENFQMGRRKRIKETRAEKDQ